MSELFRGSFRKLENGVINRDVGFAFLENDFLFIGQIYDENLVYDKSQQYEIVKKNLLDVLEFKRKTLLMEVELG